MFNRGNEDSLGLSYSEEKKLYLITWYDSGLVQDQQGYKTKEEAVEAYLYYVKAQINSDL